MVNIWLKDSYKTITSTVIPLPKTPNIETVMVLHLRPVAVLPLQDKVLNQIVGALLKTYLEDNNYLFVLQHGSRKGWSNTSSRVAF